MKEKIDPTKDIKFSARLLGKVGKTMYREAKPALMMATESFLEQTVRSVIRKK